MRTKRKILSLLLAAALMISAVPTTAFAENGGAQDSGVTIGASGLCEHHTEHTEDCSYTEGMPETACTHEHAPECYPEADSVSGNEAAEPTNCTHTKHTDDCGYAPAVEGMPCGYECAECAAAQNGDETPAEQPDPIAAVQALIDALPGADEITAENADAVGAQLTAIDEARAALTDEQTAQAEIQLDYSRYVAAIAALEALAGMDGASTPMLAATSTTTGVSYIDANGSTQTTTETVNVIDEASDITNNTLSSGWYVVQGNVTFSSRISVSGTVNLILANGYTLNASAGISVAQGNSFTVYAQSTSASEMGALIASAADYYEAGIGGESWNEQNAGTITINGGVVTASAVEMGYAAGIGGGSDGSGGNGGTITINGGVVTATGGYRAAGIGGGQGYNSGQTVGGTGGTIIINGGTVVATGGEGGAPGIGGGMGNTTGGAGGTITISGGVVTTNGIGGAGTTAQGTSGDEGSFSLSNGGIVITTADIQDSTSSSSWNGLVIANDADKSGIYGDNSFTLNEDIEIPAGTYLKIDSEETLTISDGVTLTNNGTITNGGTINGSGTIENNGTLSGDGTTSVEHYTPSAPTITTQPNAQSIAYGGTAVFDFVVSGSPTPDYQWQVNKSGSWEDITGATSSSYTTPAAEIDMSGWKYRCVATNSKGSATSNEVALTVTCTAALNTSGLTGSTAALSKETGILASDTVTLTITPNTGHTFQTAPTVSATGATAGTPTADANGVYTCAITNFNANATITVSGAAAHIHTYATDWTSDSTGHWYAATCGHDVKDGFAAHTSSGAATEDTPETCTVCGYVIAPALGHTHTFESGWTSDSTGHWHKATCGHTEQKGSFAAHTPGAAATATTPQTCTVCDYVITPATGGGYDDGDDDYTPPAPKPQPETGESGGWNEIRSELRGAQSGDTIVVQMNGATVVPKEVLREIAQREITVIFEMSDGVSWTVNGKDIPQTIGDLDLGIKTDSNSIPVTVINALTGEVLTMQFELSHSGPFGTILYLTLDVDRENRGCWANLYYFDEALKELVFQYASRIDANGKASWPFDHASSYAIVIDEENHDPDGNKTNPNTGGNDNPDTGAGNPFTDVKETDWFYEDVLFVYYEGIMLGTSDTTFSPNGTLTRGMMAAILWRMEGSPAPSGKNPFTDVPADEYYTDAATWANEQGIFEGYGNKLFGPDDPITRQQLATIFYRYAEYKGYDLTPTDSLDRFTDTAEIADWAQDAVKWVVGSGLMFGTTDTTLAPTATATRAQIAVILHRFIEKYGLEEKETYTGLMGWVDPNSDYLNFPKTGDGTNAGHWAGLTLFAAAGTGATILVFQRKRRKDDDGATPTPA